LAAAWNLTQFGSIRLETSGNMSRHFYGDPVACCYVAA